MSAPTRGRLTMLELAEELERHLAELKALPREQAIEEAREALYETGVTDEDGKVKERIVTQWW